MTSWCRCTGRCKSLERVTEHLETSLKRKKKEVSSFCTPRHVALLKDAENLMVVKRHDMYNKRVHLAALASPAEAVGDLFPDLPMDGHNFVLGTLPYDAYCTADEDPNPVDERHVFVNHSGYEILMLEEVAKKLVSWGKLGFFLVSVRKKTALLFLLGFHLRPRKFSRLRLGQHHQRDVERAGQNDHGG